MVSPVIQSALQQMQSLSAEAAGENRRARHVDAAVGQGGFAEELHTSIERINQLQQTAKAKGMALQAGVEGVSLNEVMVDMQKASVAFEMGVQVRNRLISAYKEIMNMQV
ncbi:MAG: flagellar hook-basal body complex protein FliE [Gammaproteobacteria bacterium]|nr:MAG: flagellar hook-basal body complex protein FliE [Gammaproteobacteria bacterium]